MKQYRIHESNLERLQKKVNRIHNKCVKYGCDFSYSEVGEEFVEKLDDHGVKHIERYVIVECEGTAKVNGWIFAGTIDFTDAGNIIRQATDIEVPERYRTAECECEHCHSRRHRKQTYLVYNTETEEFKQVGSSCLADFTNGLSAEGVAGYIEMFDELIAGEAPSGSSYGGEYYLLKDLLIYAAEQVNKLGYHSSDYDDDSTRTTTWRNWAYDNAGYRLNKYQIEDVEEYRRRFNPNYSNPELASFVDEMVEYIKGIDPSSSYENNLKVIASSPYLTYKNLGYAVSMVPFYNRYLGKVKKAAEAESRRQKEMVSEYVGSVGDRIDIQNPTVQFICSWSNMYGYTYRYKLTDSNNNVYMWDASNDMEEDTRNILSIRGTVKKHEEYNGVKQTWLTRCKVTSEPKAKEEPKYVEVTQGDVDFAEIFDMLEEEVC